MARRTQRLDPFSWYNPKLEEHERGVFRRGIFARAKIRKGETVLVFGGRIFTHSDVDRVDRNHDNALQLDDRFYLASDPDIDPDEEGIGLNHSCDPNAGFRGEVTLVAMRDIARGEEICFDYAMSESSPHFKIARCRCGTARCRGTIRGSDWRLHALRRRYRGYFSAYLSEKIRRRKGSRSTKR